MNVPVLAASTVILLRRGRAPLEVFMLQRNPNSGFVPGAHLFPGGAVDRADSDEALATRSTLHQSRAAELLGRPDGLAFWIASLRETFEEAGLLLAHRQEHDTHSGQLSFDDPGVAARFGEHRRMVDQGRRPFADVCNEEDLMLHTHELHPFARWITPLGAPRRYDTRFFVGRAPDSQTASHDGIETVDAKWIAPDDALDRDLSGEWKMIEPTVRTLEVLARFEDADSALEAITAASAEGRPAQLNDHGGVRIRLPFDEVDVERNGIAS